MSTLVAAPNTGGALNVTAAGVGELVNAAASGRLDAVKELLAARQEMGAARDHWAECELLALTNAGIGGHAAVVEFLLNAELVFFTNVFSRHCGGDDVFNAAAERGSVAILKLLLEAGLTKDPLTEGLQLAAANGHVAAVEFLLVSKVSHVNQISTKMRHGQSCGVLMCPTALWTASDAGHADVVKLLLEWGAKVNATSGRQTSLRRAQAGGHDKVMELLLAAGGQEEAPKGNKTEKLDMGRFSALNLNLRKPTSVVEESRQKGTVTCNKESGPI